MGPQEIFRDVSFALIVLLVLMLLIYRRWTKEILEKVGEDLDNFFGGGPPTAMHPSPSNDSALLRRRFRKTEN